MRWFVLAVLLCASRLAHAQEVAAPQSAQDWFQHGVALSRSAQWSDARAAYLQSLQLEPRVSTYFNLATVSLKLELGRATLLALDDFAQRADPRVHAEFLADAARMRAEAFALTGTVILTGLGADTTFEVDDEARRWPVGAEHQISLDPGHHVLVLRAPSYVTTTLEVDVTRGVTTRLSPTMPTVPIMREEPPVARQPAVATPVSRESHGVHPALLWGGIAALSLGALATVLVLTLGSDVQTTPPGAGGSLDMVFD